MSAQQHQALDGDHDLAMRIQQQASLSGRPSSIDMALNLERQLDAEHDEHDNDLEQNRVSLDPLVISGIVVNLRAELARVARERDELADALAAAPTREAELREALELLTERCAAIEPELERLRRKSQDDDDAIHMLRTKVEESRRGLMRLQTESKRMSQMTLIDTGRANLFFGTGPSTAKRASFTPLTGTGAMRIQSHRRISSVSEPSFMSMMGGDTSSDAASLRLSPTTRAASFPEDSAGDKKARRASGFFGAARPMPSPSSPIRAHALVPEPGVDLSSEQLETVRRELETAHTELAAARQELCEAQEAREASEQCVTALRTFISEHAVGDLGPAHSPAGSAASILKLPPLPTDKHADLDWEAQVEAQKGKPGAGWSFGKLWRGDSGGSTSPSTSRPESTGFTPAFETAPAIVATPPAGATSPSSIARKLGGFFGGTRASSITSIASLSSASSALPLPPNPRTAHGQQEPTLNGLGSDGEESADELLEPVSPALELDAAQAGARVMVRDATSGSASSAGSELDAVSLKDKAAAAVTTGVIQIEPSV